MCQICARTSPEFRFLFVEKEENSHGRHDYIHGGENTKKVKVAFEASGMREERVEKNEICEDRD